MRDLLKIFGINLGYLDHPSFRVFWNSPSQNCPKLGVDLELAKYGIEANENQSWNGSVVNILYSNVIATWPYYDANENAVNGGIPQLGDLDRHLDSVKRTVSKMIPDKNFDGYFKRRCARVKKFKNRDSRLGNMGPSLGTQLGQSADLPRQKPHSRAKNVSELNTGKAD